MNAFQFPIGLDQPTTFNDPLPKRVDVAIIGGGVIGIMSALFLAQHGLKVCVLEKGRVAGEQSSRNWGWIRQQGRDSAELPIMMEANRLWKDLAPRLDTDIGLTQGGITYMARTQKRAQGFEEFKKIADAHNLDTTILSPRALSDQIPGMKRDFYMGMVTPSDLRAEPWKTVPAVARYAQKHGVQIIEMCAVRCLDITAGRVSGVITESGYVGADHVLLAGGAWSSLFLQNHDVKIPQLSVRATVVATQAMPQVYQGGATDEHIAFRARQDGGYTLATGSTHDLFLGWDAIRHAPKFFPVFKQDPFNNRLIPIGPNSYPDTWTGNRHWKDGQSPFENARILNPPPSQKALRIIRHEFHALFPQLPKVNFAQSWAGMIDTMPDVVPILDQCPKLPGLTIATGMCGHGFGIGPGIGRVMADMIVGKPIGHDLSRFRFSRFTDGSKIDIGPAL
jgi:glycine/D-amino acid oxidase-like deaminating enzyme